MTKKTHSSGASKLNQSVSGAFNQVKKSLKIFRSFEKSAFAKARSFARVPRLSEHKQLTNERILNGLKNLGVATCDDLESLQRKVQRIEASMNAKKSNRTTGRV